MMKRTALVSGIALLAALTSCSTAEHTDTHSTSVRPSTVATRGAQQTESAGPTAPPLPAGRVVAETEVTTPDDSIRLRIRVKANGKGGYFAHFTGYHSTGRKGLEIFFRQFDEHLGDAIEDGISFGYTNWGMAGGTRTAPPSHLSLAAAGVDPSFLRTVVLVRETVADDDYRRTVIAVAQLHWTIPSPFPDLDVEDQGSQPHARGDVELSNGQPHFYTVARNDTYNGIVKRFGISKDELLYLNARQKVGALGSPETRDVLNLDPAQR